MRKFFVVLLISVLTISALMANGTSETTQKFTINLGIPESLENPVGVMASEFKKIVEEKTDGNIKVQVFPSNQLGGPSEMIEAVQLGNQEMTVVTPAWVSAFVPQISVLSFPFLFETREKAYELLDGVVGDELKVAADKAGITILGFPEVGYRQVTNSKRPITKLEDFAGIKIRVQGDPVHIAAFKALGANPVSLNFSELYSALQQKVVDGQENSPTNIALNKFDEVQKYLSYTSILYDAWVIAMNKGFYDSLPENYKTIVQDAIKEVVPLQRKLSAEADVVYREKLKATITSNEIEQKEMERIIESARSVYSQFNDKIGADLINKVLAALK
ncbi:MAG: DctP family TRAP transporter solute-binding subunit [Sphaerochaeta sp.]|nr:DctP family TRAP transporter solute-binding subunit [Sphaerochaeta sp.]